MYPVPSITAVCHDDFKAPPSGRPGKLIAANMGRNYNSLIQELERRPLPGGKPGQVRRFALDDLLPFMQQTGSDRPLETLCEARHGVFVPLPRDTASLSSATEHTLAAIKKFSDHMQTVASALMDGRVTHEELCRVKEECWKSISAELALYKHLETLCEEDA